jgi:hypothetical protein
MAMISSGSKADEGEASWVGGPDATGRMLRVEGTGRVLHMLMDDQSGRTRLSS